MRQMKDSNVDWIGEIPEDWSLERIQSLTSEINVKNNPIQTTDVLSLTIKDGVIPYEEKGDMGNKSKDNHEEYKLAYPDTIVLNSMNILIGAVGLCNYFGCVSPVYYVFKNNEKSDLRYINYIMSSQPFQKYLRKYANGILEIRLRVSAQNIMKRHIPTPSLDEQSRIATFLDQKCGEVDSLISLQEEMISELQAFKQSVITEAVTKGLDKNVKMKDSGVEWIGEIPENWNLLPIRALFTKRNQKNNPILSTERLSLSIGVGITKYADKTTNLDRFKDDFTAYQLAYPEDIVLNSMNMIVGAVGKSAYMGCVSPVYYVITAKEFVDPNFYGYLLNCARIREAYHSLGRGIYAIERGEGRVNTCRLKVPYYNFSIIKVPVPSYEEQVKIASYIKEKMEQIDSLIALKQQKITELKDYKKSIIYECVTGKKEVV